MSATALPLRRLRAAELITRRHSRLDRLRVDLADGARTTLHVASYDLGSFTPRVVLLSRPEPLIRWCRHEGVRDAVVGGFFIRSRYEPLGALQIAGVPRSSVPFDPPWGELRACLQIDGGKVAIAGRHALGPAPAGDLLQAGPLLLSGGRCVETAGQDREGFSAGSHQFDSDITAGRYPRAAMAITDRRLLTVACDGRTVQDAGMTLAELARALLELGASDALNLDGGGSASLIYSGRLRNRPREEHGVDLLEGRPILTAVVVEPRSG